MLLLVGLLLALIGGLISLNRLRQIATTAPRIGLNQPVPTDNLPEDRKLSVIIPAYNEADNIEACVRSVLDSTDWNNDRLEVWVVDDQSIDSTLKIITDLQTTLADPRLHILAGQPRPTDKPWLGKNWACYQGAQQATGDYLLFLDADVRLQPGSLPAAIAQMQQNSIDLMTGVLTLVCQSWGEWLAQPLIVSLIISALPFSAVNDPNSGASFAAGQFMLFRRSAYAAIGGHASVADQVVEDVELARQIKQKGLKLHYAIIHDWGKLWMYPTTAALWEGWTKNWYLGSRRNLSRTMLGALVILWLTVLPLFAAIATTATIILANWNWLDLANLTIALAILLIHYFIRREVWAIAAIPPRYWWLTGVGGLFVTAIILASILKTETGWGWTWRGRPLQLPQSNGQI